MRQGILTKYVGPTNHRGARVVARCDAGRKTVPWDHALDVPENHRAAAMALAESLGWYGQHGQRDRLIGCGLYQGCTWHYAWTLVEGTTDDALTAAGAPSDLPSA